MGLSEILQAMERKAEQQIVARESATDKESRSIIDAAEVEAMRIKETYRAKAKERLHREQARLFSAAQLDRQRQLAAAREHWLGQVLARARQQLTTLRVGASYARGYEQLCREAIGEFAFTIKVEIDPRDEPLMRQIMATLGVEGEILPTLETSGGLRVSSVDGCITVDNTVETRLENGWRDLRQRLAVLLTTEEMSCPATTVTPTRASAL
jgi:vacuolar-type H+-ATPase subunit E/Vma4